MAQPKVKVNKPKVVAPKNPSATTSIAPAYQGDQEIMERARRAVEQFRKRLPRYDAYAKAFTKNDKARVVMHAGTPCTTADGTIYLRPPIELGDDLKHDTTKCAHRDQDGHQICPACKMNDDANLTVFHEIGHHAHDSFRSISSDEAVQVLRRALDDAGAADGTTRAGKIARKLDTAQVTSYVEAAHFISPYMSHLLNALEDVRVNRGMCEARPGLARMFKSFNQRIFDGEVVGLDGQSMNWKDAPVDPQVLIALYAKASGVNIKGRFAPEVEAAVGDRELTMLLFKLNSARSITSVYRLAFPIMERLRELGFCKTDDDIQDDPPPIMGNPGPQDGGADPDDQDADDADQDADQDGSGSDDGDQDGSGSDDGDQDGSGSDDGDQDGSGSDDGDQDGSGSDDGDQDGSGSDDGDQDGSGSDDGDQDGSGSDDGDQDGSGSDDGDQDGSGSDDGDQDGSGGAGDPADQDRGSPEDLEKLLGRANGHGGFGGGGEDNTTGGTERREIDRALVQGDFDEASSGVYELRKVPRDKKTNPYSRRKSQSFWGESDQPIKVPEMILGRAVREMRIVLAKNKRTNYSKDKTSGAINRKVLARRVPTEDPRLFGKREKPGKRDYFFTIGLDLSASTWGDRNEMIKMAAAAQAETLSRLNIPFQILCHSAVSHDGSYRLYDLLIGEVKTAQEPWNDAARRRLGSLQPIMGNLDGHTLEFYRKMTERSRATDRVILYYTDGAMPSQNPDEEGHVLVREIDYCRKQDITLVGVGIQNDDPTQYGLDTVRIDTMEDVPLLVRELKKRIS